MEAQTGDGTLSRDLFKTRLGRVERDVMKFRRSLHSVGLGTWAGNEMRYGRLSFRADSSTRPRARSDHVHHMETLP